MKVANTRKLSEGSALVIVMVFIAVFGALACGMLLAAMGNLKSAELLSASKQAQASAESGLEFFRNAANGVRLPNPGTPADVLNALATAVNVRFQSPLLAGHPATVSGTTLTIPAVTLNAPWGPTAFETMVVSLGSDRYRLQSSGAFAECRKTVLSEFRTVDDISLLTSYGVASCSRILMKGNCRITGVNDSLEGSVLSTSQLYMDPIDLTGHVEISGNAAITNPRGNVSLTGNSTVGGDILIGVQEPPFPTIDTSIFLPYATHVLDPSVHNYSGGYFENIRIPPNTNPTFNGSVTIRGVVYVDSPNCVTFTGGAALVGVIVTPGGSNGSDFTHNSIRFLGNTSANGTAALPDLPQFQGLRGLDGSFLLAPGFQVEFGGGFSTINGSIAASNLCFSGDSNSLIRGSVINYDKTDMNVSGNSQISIDHSHLDKPPAGMTFPRKIVCVAGTYNE
jgi:hypothetical protein